MKGVALLCLGVVLLASEVRCHARVANPPQRGSLWRHAEYDHANPGRQPDDHENFCGGRGVTNEYAGACGVCGDSILAPRPRNHEIGGAFERGIIVANYTSGQTVPVQLQIEANHQGWHEFRLCPYSITGVETEACFNQHLLRYSDGSTRHPISTSESIVLPAGVTCARCVLQWHWYGEGSEQIYRNCVDISIR